MHFFVSAHSSRCILALTILLLFLVGFFGAGFAGMAIDSQGYMGSCPFMNAVVLCQMSPLAHIAEWQNLFIILPPKEVAAFLSTMLFLSAAFFAVFPEVFINILNVSKMRTYMLWYKFRISNIQPVLGEAFSNGILNPRIF